MVLSKVCSELSWRKEGKVTGAGSGILGYHLDLKVYSNPFAFPATIKNMLREFTAPMDTDIIIGQERLPVFEPKLIQILF